MADFQYFTPDEFRKCLPSCSIDDMNKDFLSMLDRARSKSDVPFKLNSAYRTVEYEKRKGRKGTSSHCKGLAVDIACPDGYSRLSILSSLIRTGFIRIGIGMHFIHVDMDFEKPSSIWRYEY